MRGPYYRIKERNDLIEFFPILLVEESAMAEILVSDIIFQMIVHKTTP